MGLEAETSCEVAGKAHEVKALLESTELILRGGLKRRLPISGLSDIAVEGDVLRFVSSGESYALALGASRAAAWTRKLTTPPPSLAKKLGVAPETPAFVIGAITDPALCQALMGNTAEKAKDASVFLAVVQDEAGLKAALKAHGKSALPIWIINVKGPKSPLGENTIRTILRAAGYKDTKTCAVSETLSGTRYSR